MIPASRPPLDETVSESLDFEQAGREIHDRIRRLYPICRSITGNGVRETLRIIAGEIPIDIREVASGTAAFDWQIPREWNIRDAYIKNLAGERVVDFNASNLHVVSYSVPVRSQMTLAQLQPHLFSIPEHPDWIPYKTSYYRETWGFCLSERQRSSLRDESYEVCIDSTLENGHLTYAECCLPGTEAGEVLFSTHVCHPSLCNDNLSGVSLAVSLARLLQSRKRRYTYRFLFVPGTIGAIAWLSLNENRATAVKHGLVLACIGDRGRLSYKQSRQGIAEIDRVVQHVLKQSNRGGRVEEFSPYGYDERQYCSPGFNLPVGVLSRTPHGQFAEYHTSADNLDLVDAASLADSLEACLSIVDVLEGNGTFLNASPKCEPQLGKRGLYATMGGHSADNRMQEAALLWILNQSDGTQSLLDIAGKSGLPFAVIRAAATALLDRGLLRPSV
jgi:aminopeptidase-like protein